MSDVNPTVLLRQTNSGSGLLTTRDLPVICRYRAMAGVSVRRVFRLAGLLSMLIVTACTGDVPDSQAPMDTSWYKNHLISDNLEPRLRYGITPTGFYQPNLMADWKPGDEQTGTLISQCRAIYVMAMGYEISSDNRYLEAMTATADFLLEHFEIPGVPGSWRSRVAPDGTVVSDEFHAYGYAHVIFSLSHAYQVSKDRKYLEAALRTWNSLGLDRALNRTNKSYEMRGLNFALHAFESLLVLYKATHSELIFQDLNRLGDTILQDFYNAKEGFFAEYLDPSYLHDPGGNIRLGHNVELAFLLSRAVDAGLPQHFLMVANNTLDFVLRHGYDKASGSLPHETDFSGHISDPTVYWWSQSELLRCLAHFAMERRRTELLPLFSKSLEFARIHFLDPVHGGWFPLPDADDSPKGSEWKSGYHVVMMLTEILRLNDTRFHSGHEVLL